jgi:cytoskeleton protein RodZ
MSYHVSETSLRQPHDMGEFGQKFRKAREARELSFDDVSNVIKIGPKMLRAIEDENFDQLPGGVFNKGFIRAYAKQLGLNPEEAIAEYQTRLREIQQARIEAQQAWKPDAEKARTTAAKAPADTRRQASVTVAPPPPVKPPAMMQPPRAERPRPPRSSAPKPPTEIPWRLVAVGLVVVVLGILLWTRPRALNMGAIKPSAIHPAPSDSSSSAPAPTKPQTSPPASLPQSTPNAQTAQPATPPTDGTAAADKNEDKNDVTVRTFDKPVVKAPAPAPAAGSFTLIVRASENSWVSVSADGQLLAQETLIAPAHPSFHASREFVVKVGNAAAISFVVNGKEIAPQGGESEVRTLVFDSSGLKSTPATSN